MQGLIPPLRHLCSPVFVPGPCPPSQPTSPPAQCLTALPDCSLLPLIPFHGLLPTKCQSLAWDRGGGPLPTQPSPAALPHTAPFPAHAPSLAPCLALLTIFPLLVWPLTSSASSPYPHPSVLGPSIPGSQALSLGTRSPPLPSSLSSSPISLPLQPPLLRLLTHPLPLPLPPSLSPTSLFQLRTGSSGQFPHRSASGEETAPLR